MNVYKKYGLYSKKANEEERAEKSDYKLTKERTLDGEDVQVSTVVYAENEQGLMTTGYVGFFKGKYEDVIFYELAS